MLTKGEAEDKRRVIRVLQKLGILDNREDAESLAEDLGLPTTDEELFFGARQWEQPTT